MTSLHAGGSFKNWAKLLVLLYQSRGAAAQPGGQYEMRSTVPITAGASAAKLPEEEEAAAAHMRSLFALFDADADDKARKK